MSVGDWRLGNWLCAMAMVRGRRSERDDVAERARSPPKNRGVCGVWFGCKKVQDGPPPRRNSL